MLTITPGTVAAMRAHAVEAFPEECCGVVFSGPAGQVVRRWTNVQNQLHAADPEGNPRDARTAYAPAPRDLIEMERQAGEPGWRILLIYHSHPEHGAYFSPTDRARASYEDPETGREPFYPDATWAVLSVYDRAVRDMKAYAWDPATRDFVEAAFAIAP